MLSRSSLGAMPAELAATPERPRGNWPPFAEDGS
jgi:hypothetical protein